MKSIRDRLAVLLMLCLLVWGAVPALAAETVDETRIGSIRQQPFREQLLFLPLSLRLIPFLMESHILKLVIFSQPMLFRTDTNIAFQKVGILFVHVRTVLLNLSTERRTCLSLFR